MRMLSMSSPDASQARASRWLIPLAGLAGGMAIANVFYSQPLLASVGAAFRTDPALTATWTTLTQAGFAAGLLLVLPLGDVVNRRRLAPALMVLGAASLAASALAPTLAILAFAGIAVGLASMASQLLVALAADIAPEAARGRVVAWVMVGVLLGAQLSRTVAGLLAQAYGWRSVYAVAAGGAVLMSALLWLNVPSSPKAGGVSYGRLMASVATLLVEEPVLRLRALYGAVAMAAFSIFWTAATFYLAGAPHHLSVAAIGFFSLAGLAAPAIAILAGRLVDAGRFGPATGAFSALAVGGFVLTALGSGHLSSLAVGAALLSAGTIGVHVTSQGVVLRLRSGARSRLNAVYMSSFFLGGVAGSAAAGLAFRDGGWTAVCALGTGFATISLALWLYELTQPSRSLAASAVPIERALLPTALATQTGGSAMTVDRK